jgi:alginate O-acetyltransferase complex protein AlgJ
LTLLAFVLVGCDEAGGENRADAPATNGNGKATAPAEGTGIPEVIGAPAISDPAEGRAGSEERAKEFMKAAADRVEEKPSVQGADPKWFFLVRELKQMALGKFWTKDWAKVTQNKTNPIPSMVEFRDLLKAKGVELIVVPVPAKASIYPDKLDASFAPGDPYPLTPLIEKMQKAGLNAIDLESVMRQRREAQPDEKLWCEQDAHFSPMACEVIAGIIKTEVEKGEWYAALPKEELKRSDPTPLEIEGDQIKGSEWEGQVAKEVLNVQYAGREKEGRIEPLEPDRESPVLLLGDSHTLVFQEGASSGMHCKGGGLFDQLSYELGFPLDLAGVRGSGLVQARKTLFYTAAPIDGYWENKKAVVWVFSVREFTQSFDKIIPIPIEKP